MRHGSQPEVTFAGDLFIVTGTTNHAQGTDMTDPKRIHSANWYRAITLRERITSLRAIDGAAATGMGVDSDLALRRMNQWRSQQPFTMDSRFSQRIALDGIGEGEFLHLLGESAESLQKRFLGPPS